MNYPASISRDPYWAEDLAEALNNKPHFIEPGDDVKYEDYRYVGSHNAFVYNRFYQVVRQQDQTTAVITIILEDYAAPGRTSAEIGDAVTEAGLPQGSLLFTPADFRAAGNAFPTLGWMRTNNKRLLVFSQNAAEKDNFFRQFDHFFENGYGTSDEKALCSERPESAASPAAGRRLVAFNHFPGPAQGSGVTPTTEMQKWRVESGTAEAIILKAQRARFAGGRMFNGYWADRVIDCSNHLEEEGDLSIFDYVNDLNTGHDLRLVEEGRGYHITSAYDRNFHLAKYEGKYATTAKTAVSHRLRSAEATRPELIADKSKVYLRTTAAGAGDKVYLNAEGQFNLEYSAKAGTDEEWTVMRVDTRNAGPLRFGETVRFKSSRQSKEANEPRYLSRESDNYLGTRRANDSDPKNKGIDWVIEGAKKTVLRRPSRAGAPLPSKR